VFPIAVTGLTFTIAAKVCCIASNVFDVSNLNESRAVTETTGLSFFGVLGTFSFGGVAFFLTGSLAS